jgi:hypothetical protein
MNMIDGPVFHDVVLPVGIGLMLSLVCEVARGVMLSVS